MRRWSGMIAVGVAVAGVAWAAVAATIPETQTFVAAWHSAGRTEEAFPDPSLILDVRAFGAAGDGVANDQPAFKAALAALSNRAGVVYAPAGVYRLRAPLVLPAGAILRGESATNVTLLFGPEVVSHAIEIRGAPFGPFRPVRSGARQGSTRIEAEEPAALTPGRYAAIRMRRPSDWGLSRWATNSIGQIVRITAVEGRAVTFDQPLRLDFEPYEPEIAPFDRPITNVGVEYLRITRELSPDTSTEAGRNNLFTIRLAYAADCWVRGVESWKCFGAHIGVEYGTHNAFRGNYLHEAHEYDGGGSGYGIRFEFMSGENLAEDNVFRLLRHSMLCQIGANGNVFAYNDSREGRNEWKMQTSDITMHGNFPFANLAEGNSCSFISMDNSHGRNGPYNTFFRNRVTHRYGISDEPSDRDAAYVGNEVAGAFDPVPARGFIYGNMGPAGPVPVTSRPWSNLTDYSYYLTPDPLREPPRPAWWTAAGSHARPFGPVEGPPFAASDRRLPATVRVESGGPVAVPPVGGGANRIE